MLRKIWALIVVVVVSFSAHAKDDSLDVDSPTKRVVLANGLTVIVREDHRMPVLVSQIWYRVGSSYEHGGITGISHLFEHLMFKGTQRFPEGQFSKIIAVNGGQQNAFTSNDFTVYFQLLANDKLPISFELEADRMRHLILKSELIEKEKQIVLEERRLRTDDQPPMRTYERFRAASFVSSSYRYPVIGWPDDILSYTMDDIKNWYHSWYSPNNATIVVVGDVQPDEVIALAEKYFGGIPAQTLPVIKPQSEVVSLGERRAEVNVPAVMGQLFVGYDVPVVKTAQVAWEPYALTLLSAVLDGGQSSRLNKELVRKQQIAVEAGTSYDPFERKDSTFMIMVTPRDATKMAALEDALYQQITDLKTNLIPAPELERIKTLFIANQIYQKDSLSNQAILLGSLESVGLSIDLEKQFIDNIQNITSEQIREVANKYMTKTRRTVTVLNPLPLS